MEMQGVSVPRGRRGLAGGGVAARAGEPRALSVFSGLVWWRRGEKEREKEREGGCVCVCGPPALPGQTRIDVPPIFPGGSEQQDRSGPNCRHAKPQEAGRPLGRARDSRHQKGGLWLCCVSLREFFTRARAVGSAAASFERAEGLIYRSSCYVIEKKWGDSAGGERWSVRRAFKRGKGDAWRLWRIRRTAANADAR